MVIVRNIPWILWLTLCKKKYNAVNSKNKKIVSYQFKIENTNTNNIKMRLYVAQTKSQSSAWCPLTCCISWSSLTFSSIKTFLISFLIPLVCLRLFRIHYMIVLLSFFIYNRRASRIILSFSCIVYIYFFLNGRRLF